MAGRAPIDRRAAVGVILCDMWRAVAFTTTGDEVGRVTILIATQLQQQGSQQPLGRDRWSSFARVKFGEGGRQLPQRLVDQIAGSLIFAAHRSARTSCQSCSKAGRWHEGTGEQTDQSSRSFDIVSSVVPLNVCDRPAALKELCRVIAKRTMRAPGLPRSGGWPTSVE